MINNVLFDLDGTLADTAVDLSNALNQLRRNRDLPNLPIETIRPSVSLGGNAMIKLALDVDETDAEHPAILEQFLNIYRENIASESTLFDGIEDVLISLENNNVQWGIVTNKSAWLTEPLIKALDLEHRASCVVSGDTTEHRKPHPASILHACELTQSDPATTVYIGDALRDIEAGRRAGM